MYFNQIRQVIKQYRIVVEKLSKMKNKKKYAIEIPDLLLERTSLKESFIAKKHAARANISLLKDGLDVLKDRECVGRRHGERERRAVVFPPRDFILTPPPPFALVRVHRVSRLKGIQDEYREVDNEFKELCVTARAPPQAPLYTRESAHP